jgi:NitT/TauT family transport system permease protein
LIGNIRWGVFVLGLILIWATISSLGIFPPSVIPPPHSVVRSLLRGIADGSLPRASFFSVQRIVLGFGISMTLGVTVGWLIARSKLLQDTLGRLVLSLQMVPSIAWFPLAVAWFGRTSETAIMFVILMGATIPVIISVDTGVRNIPNNLLRVASMMGASQGQMVRWVTIPASIPALTVGMRLGWAFAWRALLSAELLSPRAGLGNILDASRKADEVAGVFAVILIIGVIGFLMDQVLFRRLESHIAARWDVAT